MATDYIKEIIEDMDSKSDIRTKDWLFVESGVPVITAMIIYFFISFYGPKFMKSRKPIDLGHILTLYNFALVGLSSYMTYEFFMSAYLSNYTLGCQTVDYSTTPLALRMASVCWFYYISKYIEMADTIFFILRKKFNQITFLHVFHHGTMVFNWWLTVKYVPGGPSFFHAMLNCFVHVVMYSYYGLSAIPSVRPYLWWKKYVTSIQLIQFAAVLIHSINFTSRCDFNPGFCWLAILYAIAMILLFSNYYYKEFIYRARLRKIQKEDVPNGHCNHENELKHHMKSD